MVTPRARVMAQFNALSDTRFVGSAYVREVYSSRGVKVHEMQQTRKQRFSQRIEAMFKMLPPRLSFSAWAGAHASLLPTGLLMFAWALQMHCLFKQRT